MMLSEVSRDDYTRTFKSTSVSDVYLIFWGESFEWPRQILSTPPPHLPTPPRRTLRCWHVDKSSCLSQPCVLIRSSTSKDWIIACCPRACRSLPCCRTAGDRQSALSLRALGGEKNWEQSVQSAGGRWMMCLHWHQHNWEILTQHCVRRWKIKFVHPLEFEFLQFIHKLCLCLHLCHTYADDYNLTTFHVFPPKANDGLNLVTHRASCSSDNLQLMCPLAVYVTLDHSSYQTVISSFYLCLVIALQDQPTSPKCQITESCPESIPHMFLFLQPKRSALLPL